MGSWDRGPGSFSAAGGGSVVDGLLDTSASLSLRIAQGIQIIKTATVPASACKRPNTTQVRCSGAGRAGAAALASPGSTSSGGWGWQRRPA